MPWTSSTPDVSLTPDFPAVHSNGTFNSEGASLSTKIAALSLLPIVIICGLLGNCLVCRAVFRYQKLRCVANSFIVSLAVSDMAVCGIIMPFAAYQELANGKHWRLGPFLCNLWVALDVLLCTASTWNMCAIALDRCMAITNPVWYVNRRTPLMATIAICGTWGLSLVLSVMVLFLMGENFGGSKDYACQVSPRPVIAVVSASVTFYIPCLIVVALYLKIFIAARRHLRGKSIRAALSSLHSNVHKRRSSANNPNKSSGSDTNGKMQADRLAQFPEDANDKNVAGPDIALELQASSPEGTPATPNNGCQGPRSTFGSPCLSANVSIQTPFNLNVPDLDPRDRSSVADTSERNDVASSDATKIALSPRSSNRSGQSGRARFKRISFSRERRTAAVLAVVIGVFICCWLPFFIVYIIVGVCPYCHVTDVTFQVLTWLGWCNSILNPLIYTIFNIDFRCAFRKILLEGPC
ncbi:probable G-protein coupled receptor No18 [Diadema antillarum]|uniref:probable G-protein coupled receptor No18 n=1 Tax=Diadema antillarum TaxID=105358 RepID=UPI003A875C9D